MSGFHRLHSLRLENDARGFEMEEMRPRFAALSTRHEDGTAPRAVSAFQLFQTPPELAARLVALLPMLGRVLEPSAGLGRLLDAMPAASDVVAVEVAPVLAGELFRQDRERVKILQRDFLTITPSETGLFDSVAMNPPFSRGRDIKHILHACAFLKEGSILAAICADGPRQNEILKPICETWEQLPARSFASENTGVATVLLTIRRHATNERPNWPKIRATQGDLSP